MNSQKDIQIEEAIRSMLKASSDAHNIFTPFDLCEEIIQKISSLSGRILVVSNLEFVYTLLKGDIAPDRVYFATPSIEKKRFAIALGVPSNNVIMYTKIMNKKEMDGMVFDVVVMNPPFNDESSTRNLTGKRRSSSGKLHVKFIEQALTYSKTLVVICPLKGWFLGRGSKVKTHMIQNRLIESVDFIPESVANRRFRAKVGDCGIFVVHSKGERETTSVYINGEHIRDMPANKEPQFLGCDTAADIINKLSSLPSLTERVVVTWGPNRTQAMEYVIESGTARYVPIIGAAADPLAILAVDARILDPNDALYQHRDYKPNKTLGHYRVGINYAGQPRKLSAMKIIPPDVVVSRNVTTITCTSEQEAINLISYLNTRVIRYVISQTHTGKNNSGQTFKAVPEIDLSRVWSDAELYEHFNLTIEEVKLIEDTIS